MALVARRTAHSRCTVIVGMECRIVRSRRAVIAKWVLPRPSPAVGIGRIGLGSHIGRTDPAHHAAHSRQAAAGWEVRTALVGRHIDRSRLQVRRDRRAGAGSAGSPTLNFPTRVAGWRGDFAVGSAGHRGTVGIGSLDDVVPFTYLFQR